VCTQIRMVVCVATVRYHSEEVTSVPRWPASSCVRTDVACRRLTAARSAANVCMATSPAPAKPRAARVLIPRLNTLSVCLSVCPWRLYYLLLLLLLLLLLHPFNGLLSRTAWLGSRVVSVLDSGAEWPGFKSQSRRCRVTVLGKLFTPIVPLFTKQQNW